MLQDTTPDVQPCGTSNPASLHKEATMSNIIPDGGNCKAECRPRGNVLERSTTERRCGKPERVGDVDLAEYLAAGKFSGVLHDEGDYYCNTGKHWEVISDQEADQAVARLNGTEYTIKDGDNTKTVRLSLGDGKVAGILNRLRKRLGQPDFFANAAVGINCESGFIVFDAQGTPKLEPHSLWHRQRHVHPATWSEEADNTALAKVVRDKFAVCFKGDKDAEEKLDVIFEAAGVAMLGLGGRKNSKAVVCLGETAENGKSTLLDAIKGAMPKGSVSHVAAKDFKDKNEVAQLRGKSLNMSAEAGDAIGSEEFKKIITGDEISYKNLYKDASSFKPRAQHIFATNRMPAFPGGIGHEIRRRVLILTFNHTIMKEERDETVERLAETHPNEFLAAIVEGASRYIRQGDFTLPASSAEAMTEWLGEEKLVAALTADGYIVPPKRTEPDRLQLLLRRQAAKGK